VVINATSSFVGKAFFGNKSTYACARGFSLYGAPEVVCQADGTWTQPPICTSKSSQPNAECYMQQQFSPSTLYLFVMHIACFIKTKRKSKFLFSSKSIFEKWFNFITDIDILIGK